MQQKDLKNATGVDTSKFTKKVDLASLKSKIDKLNIGKLETSPVDLSKPSDVVKNNVVNTLSIRRNQPNDQRHICTSSRVPTLNRSKLSQ